MLRNAILFGVMASFLSACGPSLEEEARDGLALTLKDAESAQFRDLRKDSVGKICGQVNSKNSYGAYAGYAHFYVWEDLVHVDRNDDEFRLAENICNPESD